jgi:serpin B
MKRIVIPVLALAPTILGCMHGCGATASQGAFAPVVPTTQANTVMLDPSESQAVGESINGLAAPLFARLASASPGNFVFSPSSIHGAFAMTAIGARGATESELQTALAIPSGASDRLRHEGALQQRWNAPVEGRRMRVVNRLFGEATTHFEAPYLETLRASFASPLEPVDFRGDAEGVRVHINAWVDESTEHRIQDLLPPNATTADTRLVLVNAVYLDARWAQPFEQSSTFPQVFTLASGEVMQAPTMHARVMVSFGELDGAQIVEMPYEGGDLAMRFILPPVGSDASWMSVSHLGALPLERTQVDIALPKFEMTPTESLSLVSHMQALGVHLAFDAEQADFTSIATFPDPSHRLYISNAFHRAFIRVDELGTEAAAATAVVMAEGAGMPTPAPSVMFNRPFFFQLIDVPSGATLFLGRVTNPLNH